MFCWHKWPMWQDAETEVVGKLIPFNPQPDGTCTGYYKVQSRRCAKCNKLELRVARSQ